MNLALDTLWSLPGPQRFIETVEKDIADGVSLVIVFPSVELLAQFCAYYPLLASRHSNVDVLDASTQDDTPMEMIKRRFLEGEVCNFLEEVVDSLFLPQVIILEQFDACPPAQQAAWLNLLNRWGRICHGKGIDNRSILLPVLASTAGSLKYPGSDTRFYYRTWAGVLSELDIRMFCRMHASRQSMLEDLWRESLLASLSRGDIQLCACLWEAIMRSPQEIINRLTEYGERLGYPKEDLQTRLRGWKAKPPDVDLRLSPDDKDYGLISRGITTYTPEYGEEENSAVLAVLGLEDPLTHRLWRAQMALIFPLVDEIRRKLCDLLIDTLNGEDSIWVGDSEYSLPVEMGPLKKYFEELEPRAPIKQRWGSAVQDTWYYRNELAHYQPVSFDGFQRVWAIHKQLRELA